jgi:hypothetical protein
MTINFFFCFFIILENMIKNSFDMVYIKLHCKKIIDTTLYEFKQFSELVQYLNDKNILDYTNSFLSKFIKLENIFTKKFLTCFMIKHHPNVIISENTDIEKEMLKCSTRLLDSIQCIVTSKNKFSCNYYISRLKLYYSKYIILFDRWKEYDKYRILNDLSTIYFELEQDKNKRYEEIDSLSNHEFIISIEKEQQKLVDKIEKIAGKEGIEYLNNLKTEIDNYKKKIENLYISINENLHESFWNKFKLELSKNPPNMHLIIVRLGELKTLFLECDTTLKNELDSNIDEPFIEEMLNRGVIDDKYIFDMCNYIIEVLKRCNSESKDDEINLFRKKTNDELIQGIMYKDFFPKFFRYIFESIDYIKKQKELISVIRENMS